jgi:predicted ATPase/DNA-binding CsgD family transcriptional regulator
VHSTDPSRKDERVTVAPEDLTPREAEVLAAIGRRSTNREIADDLVLSVRTVETHVAALRRKLGADSRAGLIAEWQERTRTPVPRPSAPLVGRAAEVERVAAVLRTAAMVTLTGVGGVGKTRLAVEVAAGQQLHHPDGVWLCELASLSPGGPVGQAVATALGVQQRPGRTIEQSVVEYLLSRRLLLVLDNCEHVLDEAARLCELIVRHCPRTKVLATSRHSLGVVGEQLWPVPPLTPADAVALFGLRARAVQPHFADDGRDAVTEICRRLDGLPLAIELAAARIRVLTPAEIVRRLDDERLLTGGPRSAEPHHQSLEAAIGWSYALLPVAERELFARLSVFAGGADLAGVHGVCADPDSADIDTLDLLTALVDKSMVTTTTTATTTADGSRYHVLETLRAYGRARLAEAGTASDVAERHASYYVDLFERAAHGVQGPDEQHWAACIVPENDNLRAAFERASAAGWTDTVLRLAAATGESLTLRVGYEAGYWAERALEMSSESHPLYATCLGAAARAAWAHGDFARARWLAGRAGGRLLGPGTPRVNHPGDVAADVALYEGDVDRALRHYGAEAQRARDDGDAIRLAWTLYYLAVCHAARRRPEEGVAAARECRAVADATRNPTAVSMSCYALGLVLKKSDPHQALELFDRAVEVAASVRNSWWRDIARTEAAATRAVHGDPVVAAQEFVAVLDEWDRVGDLTQEWLMLRYVTRLLARLGYDDDAVTLHHALLAAGKPSPLGAAAVPSPDEELAGNGVRMGLAEAVEHARACLRTAVRRERSDDCPGQSSE